MKSACRKMLKSLGSEKAETLSWRDMWAFVTTKGGVSFILLLDFFLSFLSDFNFVSRFSTLFVFI